MEDKIKHKTSGDENYNVQDEKHTDWYEQEISHCRRKVVVY